MYPYHRSSFIGVAVIAVGAVKFLFFMIFPDKSFYDKIDATNSKRLWPTPSWVWSDAKTYRTGETRSWVGLPYEADDFKRERLQNTGNDIVAGLYKKTPSSGADKVSKWTEQALANQRVAIFEGPLPQE